MSISIDFDAVTAALLKITRLSDGSLPEAGEVHPTGVHHGSDVGPATGFEYELGNSAADIALTIGKIQTLLATEHDSIKATMAKLVGLDASLADESATFLGAIDSIPAPAHVSDATASPATTDIS